VKVRWTFRARDDLRQIAAFIEPDSPRYADLVVARIILAVDRLHQFPDSGRIVPERQDPTLREVIWQSYRIVYQYRPGSDTVLVLTVFRSERLFPDLRGATGSA
jgi:plasmid stabilization system protein ParE